MTSKSPAKAEDGKLETVTLEKPHTHAGTEYKQGDVIKVNAADKAFLIKHQIIAGEAPASK